MPNDDKHIYIYIYTYVLYNCEVDSDTNKGVKDINCKWKLLVGAR